MKVLAHAKLNLSLEVLGRRRDGYHEVTSIIQSIALADEITIEAAQDFSLECDVPTLSGEANLAMRAARKIMDRHPRGGGARIQIRKEIPVAAGLGGGSSDAAAVIVGLAVLYGMKLQPTDLQVIAADLGSDVPFFLTGGTAIVKGRGQLVYPLPDVATHWAVLIFPPHSVESKTATLYRKLTPEMWSSGERTNTLAEAISSGRAEWTSLLGNVFEQVADSVFPSMAGHREEMLAAGCSSVHLTGAGPALFSLFASEAEARSSASRLTATGHSPIVTPTLPAHQAAPSLVPIP